MKRDILNSIIEINKNQVKLLTSSNSDTIGVYVIFEYLCNYKYMPTNVWIISEDEKGLIKFSSENLFYLKKLNLNSFLNYYIGKINTREYDINSDSIKIHGWEFTYKQNFIFSEIDEFIIINRVNGFKNKFIKNEI